MTRRYFAMTLATLGFWAMLPVPTGIAADQASVVGTWAGPWYLGMTSGVAHLELTGEGALEGTLQMTNNEKFGEEAAKLTQAVADGTTLRFKVTGADGKALVAELPVSADGTRMKGFARYGGYNMRFELTRQK